MANQRQAVAAILRCHAANDAEYLHEHQGSRDARWRRIEAEVLAAFDEERSRIRRELLEARDLEEGIAFELEDALCERRIAPELYVKDNRDALREIIASRWRAALDRIIPEEKE